MMQEYVHYIIQFHGAKLRRYEGNIITEHHFGMHTPFKDQQIIYHHQSLRHIKSSHKLMVPERSTTGSIKLYQTPVLEPCK